MQGGVFGALGDAASVSKFLDTFPPEPVDVSAAGAEPSKAELQALFEKAYAQAGAAKLQAALSSVLL